MCSVRIKQTNVSKQSIIAGLSRDVDELHQGQNDESRICTDLDAPDSSAGAWGHPDGFSGNNSSISKERVVPDISACSDEEFS